MPTGEGALDGEATSDVVEAVTLVGLTGVGFLVAALVLRVDEVRQLVGAVTARGRSA